jgi:hypothetical protein
MKVDRVHPLIGSCAIDFLLWPERVAAAVSDPLTRFSGGGHDIAAQRAAWRMQARARLASAAPDVQEIELEAAFRIIEDRAGKGLLGWLEMIRTHHSYEISFESLQPIIGMEGLRGWLQASTRIDPDVLICYEIARRKLEPQIQNLRYWTPIPLIADRQLRALTRDGVSDMHVHLGGMRHHGVSWAMLAANMIPLQHFRPYAIGARKKDAQRNAEAGVIENVLEFLRLAPEAMAGDQRPNAHRLRALGDEFRALLNVAGARPDAQAAARQRLSGGQELRRPGEARGPSASAQEVHKWSKLVELQLNLERIILAEGFTALRDEKLQPEIASGVEIALQRIVYAKSIFMARHSQPASSRTGLKTFRKALDDARPNAPRPGLYEGLPISHRVPRQDYWSRLVNLQAIPQLQRLELRIAPFANVHEWKRFLWVWGRLEADIFGSSESEQKFTRLLSTPKPEDDLPFAPMRVEIGFAVSFKRSLDALQKRLPRNPDEARLAARFPKTFAHMIDRDSAVVHHLRLRESARGLSGDIQWNRRLRGVQRIKRIDLSGEERDGFCITSAFAMNLLRGEARALQGLEALRNTGGQAAESAHARRRDEHAHWLALARAGKAKAPLLLETLAATCHAGEDYAHPLEGVCAVAIAKASLCLKAGDTIGHGVALGHDVKAGGRGWIGAQVCKHGQQFDTLLWAYAQRRRRGADAYAAKFLLIEEALWRLQDELYNRDKNARVPNHLDALTDLWDLRAGPMPPLTRSSLSNHAWFSQFDASAVWHYWAESRQPEVMARRQQFVPLDRVFAELDDVTMFLQREVLRDLSEAGIALEFNPSSNLRVNPDHTLAMGRILQTLGDYAHCCLCTDDPGLFSTRIENEFAIALDALRALDVPRAAALRILNRLNAVSRDGVYWPVQ